MMVKGTDYLTECDIIPETLANFSWLMTTMDGVILMQSVSGQGIKTGEQEDM